MNAFARSTMFWAMELRRWLMGSEGTGNPRMRGLKRRAEDVILDDRTAFAMLEEDPISKEQFVIRGIVDGYLVFEDRIVLFDYKTDKYQHPTQLQDRYQFQMKLYAKALQESYQIKQVDTYLILLGGQEVEVVRV